MAEAMEQNQAALHRNAAEEGHEVARRAHERELLTARAKREDADRRWLESGARDRKARVDAKTQNENKRTKAQVDNENELTKARISDLRRQAADKRQAMKAKRDLERVELEADIADRKARTEADIENRRQLTTAKVNDGERISKTNVRERHFWLAVTAIGLALSAILTLLTDDHSLLEYRLSLLGSLLVSAGGGVQLRLIGRSEADKGQKLRDRPSRFTL